MVFCRLLLVASILPCLTYFPTRSHAAKRVWVEDSHTDFSDGSADGGLGASLYASIDGKMRVVGNDWDLNDDGWLDIVLTNETDANGNHYVYAQIYWGSPFGFDPLRVDTLSTYGGEAAAIADLNRDGYADIVVCNSGQDVGTDIYSYIFWGGPMGYSNTRRDSIYTYCPHGTVTPADLDNDGYLDLVFSSWYPSNSWSQIYWGTENGFSPSHLDSLRTSTAHGNSVADFDKDGFLDILFANYALGDGTTDIHSYLYWGSGTGYSLSRLDSLPTRGAGDDISVADLDGDGWLDIVFPNHSSEGVNHETYGYSYIYYGSSSGFSAEDSLWLPTVASWSSSVADLDRDGWLDIVFSNFPYDHTYLYSYIYRGGADGYSPDRRDSLYTRGGSAVMIADYNDDGLDDIVFGNQAYDMGTVSFAYIYWNSPYGFSISERDSLPTRGVDASVTKDLGNIYTRDSVETYYSSVLDAAGSDDSIAFWEGIAWEVDSIWTGIFPLPSTVHAEITMYVRTAKQASGDTSWSDWTMAENGCAIPGSLAGRYFQYKALFHTNYKANLALDQVTVEFQLLEDCERLILAVQPNPFGWTTTIFYEVPYSSFPVNLDIYDPSGRCVRRLLDGVYQTPGLYAIEWNGDDAAGVRVPSGAYFCRVNTANLDNVKKLVLLR